MIFPADPGKRRDPAGSVPKYRTVFDRLDKSVPDDGAWRIAAACILLVYAEIYHQRSNGRIRERIGRDGTGGFFSGKV